jgi:hypothetical protein
MISLVVAAAVLNVATSAAFLPRESRSRRLKVVVVVVVVGGTFSKSEVQIGETNRKN